MAYKRRDSPKELLLLLHPVFKYNFEVYIPNYVEKFMGVYKYLAGEFYS
jgi:hypothetical protein